MANHRCMGYWFRVGEERFYTCMWDASLVRGENCPMQGDVCPNCDRPVDGTNCGEPPAITRVLRQVQFPNGRVVTFSAQTIHGNVEPAGGMDMRATEKIIDGLGEFSEQLRRQQELIRELSSEVVALRNAHEEGVAKRDGP